MDEIVLEGTSTCDISLSEQSDWTCYLFGSTPGDSNTFLWKPQKGFKIPNIFIRWMMKICLGCTWVKE